MLIVTDKAIIIRLKSLKKICVLLQNFWLMTTLYTRNYKLTHQDWCFWLYDSELKKVSDCMMNSFAEHWIYDWISLTVTADLQNLQCSTEKVYVCFLVLASFILMLQKLISKGVQHLEKNKSSEPKNQQQKHKQKKKLASCFSNWLFIR